MSIELTPLACNSKTKAAPRCKDPDHVLNMLQNCRKAMGTDNQWGPKAVAKWTGFAEALAKADPDFVTKAAKLGITIS